MGAAILRALAKATNDSNKSSTSFIQRDISKIVIFDPFFQQHKDKCDRFFSELKQTARSGIEIVFANSALELAQMSDIVLLAVKPQYASAILAPLKGKWGTSRAGNKSSSSFPTLIISIMAGTSMRSVGKMCSASPTSSVLVARAMPNVGALVGKGTTGYSIPEFTPPTTTTTNGPSQEEKFVETAVQSILGCSGYIARVPENLLDAVTAMMGAPAFTAIFIEALSDGAVARGIPRPLANRFAAEIVCGSAALLTGDSPVFDSTLKLKEAVSSPKGTTIHGIMALEEKGFRSAVISAVVEATKRSEELKRIAEREESQKELGFKRAKM